MVRLMDSLKERFGSVFDRVCRLHSDALWQLDKACGEISSSKNRIEELEKLRREDKIKGRWSCCANTTTREMWMRSCTCY